MQKNHILKTALKDRPKTFQTIVVFLFLFSVLTVIVCSFYSLQKSNKSSLTTGNIKQSPTHPAFASFASPTAKRK
jgi:hypothetical protein